MTSDYSPDDPYYAECLRNLKDLKVKVYRGLHVMESMTEKSIDDFLHGRLASNEQWERFLNHRQLHDCFVGIEDDVILNAYSKEIEVSWRNTLSAINPRYQVYAYYDDANGPSLTFFFKK